MHSIDGVVKGIERNRRLSLGLTVPIIRAEIPAGYKVNPDNTAEAIVDTEKFELLKKARAFLKNSGYAEVAQWLTRNGFAISHNGLHKIMMARPPYNDEERRLYYPEATNI